MVDDTNMRSGDDRPKYLHVPQFCDIVGHRRQITFICILGPTVKTLENRVLITKLQTSFVILSTFVGPLFINERKGLVLCVGLAKTCYGI